jgi:hypothetical protein
MKYETMPGILEDVTETLNKLNEITNKTNDEIKTYNQLITSACRVINNHQININAMNLGFNLLFWWNLLISIILITMMYKYL